jgi:NAD(P)-dependent dehydrogenase (short-subunit alcohol dehydrogenase family)
VSFDEIRRVFEVNTLAPIRVAKAFVPLLMQGEAPRIVQMTSLMGSIADNGSGGSWSYRLSKAALNMMTKNLSHELAQSAIPCICIHPGWVRTDMGGPKAPLSIGESVAALIDTIDALSMEHSGAFLDRDGKPLPW